MPLGQLPQQPIQPVPPANPTPYDFFLVPKRKPKRSLLPQGGSSKLQRLVIILAGGVLLFITILVFFTVLFSSSKDTTSLISLAAQQNELARVATLGTDQAQSETARSLAITIKLSMYSTQKQIITLLKKQGHIVSPNELLTAKNIQNDQTLATATANNNYDQAFLSLMQNNLSTYQTSVKRLYDNTKNLNTKRLLATTYNATDLLIQQSKQPI